jgi:hypothetical protein
MDMSAQVVLMDLFFLMKVAGVSITMNAHLQVITTAPTYVSILKEVTLAAVQQVPYWQMMQLIVKILTSVPWEYLIVLRFALTLNLAITVHVSQDTSS